jgi:ribosomal protein L35
MIEKSRSRKRRLLGMTLVADVDQPRVQRMLGKR